MTKKKKNPNVVTTNKHYWEYVNKVEELALKMLFYKGEFNKYKKELKEHIQQEADLRQRQEEEFANAIVGYERGSGRPITMSEALDGADYTSTKNFQKDFRKKYTKKPTKRKS
jgi:AraC-like DNA-binding protein